MQNPTNQQFIDPDLSVLLQQLYDTSLQPAIQAKLYTPFSGILKVLADVHPADKKTILALLAPEKGKRKGTKRDASRFLSGAKPVKKVPFNPSNPDCPYCPDDTSAPAAKGQSHKTALDVLNEMHEQKEADLPDELFENDRQPKVKPRPATFKDGETVEEVLQAHGNGIVDEREVKQRLWATIQILKSNPDVQHLLMGIDGRSSTQKLAGVILESKGLNPNE